MIRKRIGKDLTFRLQVLTNGRPVDLDGRNLKLEVISKYAKLNLPYKVDGHILTFAFPAASQKHTCRYRISVWENFGEDGQTVVDICDAFELVPTTCQECGDTPGLDVETVELGAVDLEAGIAGQSAYDIWLSLGNEGTEADFIAFLRQPAVDAASKADESSHKADSAALAAQTAKDEMSELYQQVLDSESVRVRSENERIGAERDRVSAELDRGQAEAKRQSDTTAAIQRADEATKNANTAAENAETAAQEARDVVKNAILKTPQELTEDEQKQARVNIGALAIGESTERILYECQSSEEYAIPIPNTDDFLAWEYKYGTKFRRVKKTGQKVWEMTTQIYFTAYYGIAENSVIIDNGFAYVRSAPYGVYKINLDTGEYINNRTDIDRVDFIADFNGHIYAFSKEKSVVLSKDDLSLVKDLGVTYQGISTNGLNKYDDCLLVSTQYKVIVVDSGDNINEITKESLGFTGPISVAYKIESTTYIKKPAYIVYSNGKIASVIIEDGNIQTSDIPLQISIIGNLSYAEIFYSAGGWRSLMTYSNHGYICSTIPGNNKITSFYAGINNISYSGTTEFPIHKIGEQYLVRQGNYMVLKNSLL